MHQRVVHRFEVIEVDEQHTKRATARLRFPNPLGNQLFEPGPADQTCQVIPHHALLQFANRLSQIT